MVTLLEAVGWWAIAWGSHTALPVADMVDRFNDRFAARVDNGRTCWDRVSGESGVYGGPHEFSLDLACNYRLKKVAKEGIVHEWVIERQ